MSVVVLGAGSTGGAFAAALRRLDPDVPIALVERELVGGECSYYACMPTKALLRPGEALAAARNVPGAAEAVTGSLDAERVFWHRDQVTSGWDDSGAVPFFTDQSIDVVRGEGRVVEPGLVRTADRELPYEKLVIATGSVAAIPPIPGLSECAYWTNRDAATTREIPRSLVVLGAGPVGCELAQFFRRMGSRVRARRRRRSACCRATIPSRRRSSRTPFAARASSSTSAGRSRGSTSAAASRRFA